MGGEQPNEARRNVVADLLLDEVRALLAIQEAAATERDTRIQEASEQRHKLIWLVFSVVLGVGVASAVVTVRSVVQPLRRLVRATERVGAGDLRPIDVGQMPKELGLLAAAVQKMSEGLRGIVGSVADVSASLTENASQLSSRSAQVSDSARQVSRAIGEVSASAERQADAMRESDALLGDLRAAATRSAGAGQRVVGVADAIRRTAATHQGHLGAASATLLELHEVVERTKSSVDRLTGAAAAVSRKFVSLGAGQLAAQTELLALNAAMVEAAAAPVRSPWRRLRGRRGRDSTTRRDERRGGATDCEDGGNAAAASASGRRYCRRGKGTRCGRRGRRRWRHARTRGNRQGRRGSEPGGRYRGARGPRRTGSWRIGSPPLRPTSRVPRRGTPTPRRPSPIRPKSSRRPPRKSRRRQPPWWAPPIV